MQRIRCSELEVEEVQVSFNVLTSKKHYLLKRFNSHFDHLDVQINCAVK